MQITQSIRQSCFHNSILLLTGAVAGIIDGGEGFQLADGFCQFPALRVHADKVEAAEKDIRTEPVENIQKTLVGTTAEANLSAIFFQQQVLLMKVMVIGMTAVLTHGLPKDTEGKRPQQVVAGAQGDAGEELRDIRYRYQPGIALQAVIQTDVFSAAEIIAEGIFVEIDRGVVIKFQKPFQTAAMVIVTMGQNAKVRLCQVNVQLRCIVSKGTGLTGVKEDIVRVRFDVETQTVFGGQIFRRGGIFNQNRYFHGHYLRSGSHCSGPLHAG